MRPHPHRGNGRGRPLIQFAEYRNLLSRRREQIAASFESGASGREVGDALRDLIDEVVCAVYNAALQKLSPDERQKVQSELALVALGGFGRGDLAPFSDVDLLMLMAPKSHAAALKFVKGLVRDLWDVGLKLGHNVANGVEALKLAREEPISATALLEARLLAGPEGLFEDLRSRFQTYASKNETRFLRRAYEAIFEEHDKYGSTIHLLEPDVKRSKGGLRDLHLIRWICLVKHQTTDPELLVARGVMTAVDAHALLEAHRFLLKVRAELHFHAGSANDSLTRDEQVRIAAKWGYQDSESMFAVEAFMRDYFRTTGSIANLADRLIDQYRPTSFRQGVQQLVLSRRLDKGVRLAGNMLTVDAGAQKRFTRDVQSTLDLFQLMAGHDADLDRETVEFLRSVYMDRPPLVTFERETTPLPNEIVERFRALLQTPGSLNRVFRLMHQVGFLKLILPEFEHARGLLQFNAYHKYTVDEHTFVMLRHAEELSFQDDLLGRTYREVTRKDLFYLAILLHDLGKGFAEDHSEVGRRIAEAVATRLVLSEAESKVLVFLVHQHLCMSHLAYRRDVFDPRIWVQLTRATGSAQTLKMLFVLTAVDTMAVGPGVYNSWRADLLRTLYTRSLSLFGEHNVDEEYKLQADALRAELSKHLGSGEEPQRFIAALPDGYLFETSLSERAAHYQAWTQMGAEGVVTLAEYRENSNRIAYYTVLTNEDKTSGVFHKIVGALSAHHLQVLDARILTLDDGTVIDRFEVVDIHYSGKPDDDRRKRVNQTIERILSGELTVMDALWSSRSSRFGAAKQVFLSDEVRVEIDNDCSENFTVIDVFSNDRRGLLFTLAKGMHRLGLSVEYAKIATYADQAVDVFYVQEMDGTKVHRTDRVEMIKKHLARDVENLFTDPRSMGF